MTRVTVVFEWLSVFAASSAFGAPAFPVGFTAQEVAPSGDWDAITAIAVAGDGRIFAAEKRGRVHVVYANVKLPEPFLDIEAEVLNHGDRGLLGIALDPEFASSGHVYLLYTVDPTPDGLDGDDDAFGRLTRYTASSLDPNTADPASRRVLLGEDWSTAPASLSQTHTVGCLRFGPDGALFVSTGDGAHPETADAGGLDPLAFEPGKLEALEDIGAFRSQWLGSLAGKVLRIDPETGLGLETNPFFTGDPSDNSSRVWAYGLRNPFRFAVRNDALYIADVGWRTWEEVSLCPGPGVNFGWPCREGPVPEPEYSSASPAHHGCETLGTPENPSLPAEPLVYWHHSNPALASQPGLAGKAASCIAFYEGDAYPEEYRGACFFGDYTGGWIRRAQVGPDGGLTGITDFASGIEGPADIVPDPATGDLLYVSVLGSRVWRIRYGSLGGDPIAVASAAPAAGEAPLTVVFSSAGTSDPGGDPLQMLWQFGDGAVSSEADPIHVYTAPGAYRAVLSVVDTSGGYSTAFADVVVGGPQAANEPPVVAILEPPDGCTFYSGAEVVLRGVGSDAEDPPSSLEYGWEVVLHHNTHVHPSWRLLTGPTATYLPGDHEDGTGVWFEIVLRVKDSSGGTGTRSISIHPETELLFLDNGQPGTSSTGTWSTSSASGPFGLSSVFSKTAGHTYTFNVPLPESGVYRVYAWWTAFSSRAEAAPYTVIHSRGSSTTLVNQKERGNQWNYLGAYAFGPSARTTVTAVPGGFSTCADAVLILPGRGIRLPPLAVMDSILPSLAFTGSPVSLRGHGESGGAGSILGFEWVSSIDGLLSTEPELTTSVLSLGSHEIRFRVVDETGAWSEAALGEVTVLPLVPGGEVVIDDGAPGTSSKGSWKPSSGSGAYGTGSLYSKTAGDTYTFETPLPRPGAYQVHAWWTAFSSRSTAVKYTLATDSGPVTVTVDQRTRGGQWNSLGTHSFGTQARITLTSSGGGYSTCADAVRLVPAGAVPASIVLDTGDSGTASTGSWVPSGGPNPYGGGSLYSKGAVASYTYTFSALEPGTYEVLAWWTTLASRSPSVPYTVTHDAGSAVVSRSQLESGGQWNSLGTFHFTGSATVRIDARNDGKSYSADAVSLRRVGE